jgi:hypothetical protein
VHYVVESNTRQDSTQNCARADGRLSITAELRVPDDRPSAELTGLWRRLAASREGGHLGRRWSW